MLKPKIDQPLKFSHDLGVVLMRVADEDKRVVTLVGPEKSGTQPASTGKDPLSLTTRRDAIGVLARQTTDL